MNQKEAIDTLKKEMSVNPAAASVFEFFAMRKRARNHLKTSVLAKSMSKEGYSFSTAQYEEILKLLANTGFGSLELTSRGKVKGLKDIKVTFKSLGLALCGMKSPIKGFRPRNRFRRIEMATIAPEEKQVIAAVVDKTPAKAEEPHPTLGLRITLVLDDERHLDINLPKDVTPGEVANLVSRLQG